MCFGKGGKIILSLKAQASTKSSYTSKGNNLFSRRQGQSEVVNSASAQMNVLAALLVSRWWEAAGGGWQ